MPDARLTEITAELKTKYPNIEVSDKLTVTVPLADLLSLMEELKSTYGFNYLTNVTSVDYPENFFVVYNLDAVVDGPDLMVRVKLPKEDPTVPSMCSIWGGANWQEREVYDLMGIVFEGHPDLRRILLTDEWEGHPLRKDYQWVGGRG